MRKQSERTCRAPDAFRFSLGGMTTIASFVPPVALASDRLAGGRNKTRRPQRAKRRRAA